MTELSVSDMSLITLNMNEVFTGSVLKTQSIDNNGVV